MRMPEMNELAKNVAIEAINTILMDGKTIKEWIELIKASRWISVRDRLPEPDQKVLAYTAESRGAFEEYRLCCGWAIKGAVTHWMPLPEPPKEV